MLYEVITSVRRALAGLVEALSSMASSYEPLDPLAMEETRRFLNDLVITSYSIHYTKLYEIG